jgi:hypothetical protein
MQLDQAILTGGTVLKVTIDPNLGGCTIVEGGQVFPDLNHHHQPTHVHRHPPSILAAGYIGSTLFGGIFVMSGFDTLVAKILSFILGLGLVIVS